jgi:endonuclease-3 related protein
MGICKGNRGVNKNEDARLCDYATVQMKEITQVYETLLDYYGNPHWWPGDTPYEIMVGAVLTQNCAWHNVEKAIANFGGKLTPEYVLNADTAELIEIIRPAGSFNQKAAYLKAMTAWFEKYGFDVATVRREPLAKLRPELLATKGVGQETADSILLYAFDQPTFVADAYATRLCERVPIPAGKGYDKIKAYFEGNLPQSVEAYNNFHGLIVVNAKEHCRKKPICGGCPLEDICQKSI